MKFSEMEMVELCGCNYRTFKKWQVTPCEIRKEGKTTTKYYIFADVLRAYHDYQLKNNEIAYGFDSNQAKDIKQLSLELKALEVKEKQEDVIAKKLKNAIALREYLPISVLSNGLRSIVSQINVKLSSLPLNIKRKFPNLPAAVIKEIDRELIKAKNDIADVTIDWDYDDS